MNGNFKVGYRAHPNKFKLKVTKSKLYPREGYLILKSKSYATVNPFRKVKVKYTAKGSTLGIGSDLVGVQSILSIYELFMFNEKTGSFTYTKQTPESVVTSGAVCEKF